MFTSPSRIRKYFKRCTFLKRGCHVQPKEIFLCQDEVEFLGFKVTMDSLKPLMHESIQEFPTSSDISGLWLFCGLMKQLNYSFLVRETMEESRELLWPSTHFPGVGGVGGGARPYRNTLIMQIIEIIEIIIQKVSGVSMFVKIRISCIATIWSKTSIGYFLFQIRCKSSDESPTWCRDTWKLSPARSRLTKPAESL